MKTFYLKSLIIFFLTISLIFPFSTPAQASSTDNSCPEGMVFIPGGTFTMGSDSHYPSEVSASDVTVDSFCIDRHEITNAEFRKFVKATGYKTIAERPLSKSQFPNLTDDQRQPGSLVFQPPSEGIQQVAYLSWWHWTVGANWQHPYGPKSNIRGKDNYPVVHIAYDDAVAYANWVGKSLPTEAQWEYAARGGLEEQEFTWGNQYSAKKANTWQGMFPFFNTKEDKYLGTAPVESFPPNGYGLYEMTGNVWELTSDWYQVGHSGKDHSLNPIGPDKTVSFDPIKPQEGALHVIKGGSYLCAKNYCSRYRPAARESQAPDTGTTHIGFRLVVS
ncbi:MAG: formylglycine-generating enzyme family protein [Okeania sp. SIO2C2]|uniref:formylglycine-generating enzyme family protein n=1 Tax=Okeania sp. SIO2C2 TaxID=2607787 RepID=UPI0013B663B0|nr:formylglycine-generating enzyme family protein [Okeania sp. SIO2C2]NEP87005.1 formylglycine-generating enzyme family protein [Okeania sp. SIO2C2]